MLKIEMRGDTEVIAKLNNVPSSLRRELTKEVTALTLRLESRIKRDKLSGQVLNRVTGRLSRSVHSVMPVAQTPNGVVGSVKQSGDVKYGAIHEFGGKTPAHVIEPKKADALRFTIGGKVIFAKRVNHPGSVMPERSYMRSSLRDMRQQIIDGLRGAAVRGMDVKK